MLFMLELCAGAFARSSSFWLKDLQERIGPRKRGPLCAVEGAAGPILVTVLGMVAEIERKFIRGLQQAGIEAAKAKGGGHGLVAANICDDVAKSAGDHTCRLNMDRQ